MSGITKILTRTPSELGSIKTNKSPIVEENKQLPAEQWNTAADAIIEIQTVIGEAANPAAGTITEVLSDHEERIDELEQSGGGGSPDRIESPSGAAFAEATDDFLGMGTSAVLSRTNHSSGSAIAYTAILPGEGGPSHPVLMANIAATNADETQSAGIGAQYDPTTEEFRLRATGAPLQVEEPIESNHAATKGYVDAQAGGGTPGHVICNVTEDDPPIEPVPQRKNLVFFSDTADITVTDFEELDTTIVNFLSIPEYPPDIYQRATDDPNSMTYAQAMVDAFYTEGEGSAAFQIWLADHNGESSHLYFERNPGGERFVVGLGYQPSDLVFEVNDHTSYGDKEFRLLNAPTLIETPTKPAHAATKGYVDARRSDLEWWEPVWTPVANVDTVTNVECQYTRTYRAAGGSLVTLEGTITVESLGAGTCVLEAGVPVTRDGADRIYGIAAIVGADTTAGHVSISGGGGDLTIYAEASGADELAVAFRISYRAA